MTYCVPVAESGVSQRSQWQFWQQPSTESNRRRGLFRAVRRIKVYVAVYSAGGPQR
jgi:hypothetical protein